MPVSRSALCLLPDPNTYQIVGEDEAQYFATSAAPIIVDKNKRTIYGFPVEIREDMPQDMILVHSNVMRRIEEQGQVVPKPSQKTVSAAFHKLMDELGYESQWMAQDRFYMAWPRESSEHKKYGRNLYQRRNRKEVTGDH
jgi:hypothetical protein